MKDIYDLQVEALRNNDSVAYRALLPPSVQEVFDADLASFSSLIQTAWNISSYWNQSLFAYLPGCMTCLTQLAEYRMRGLHYRLNELGSYRHLDLSGITHKPTEITPQMLPHFAELQRKVRS